MGRIAALFALSLALSCVVAVPAVWGAWSAPVTLAECGLASAPAVAFPSEGPASPSGPGAIVFASDPTPCRAGAGGGGWGVTVAPLQADDVPSSPLATELNSDTLELSATGTSFGRVASAASTVAGGAFAADVDLREGRASAGLEPAEPPGLGPSADVPPVLARAYLGDAALAEVTDRGTIEVWVQRYFQRRFEHAYSVRIPSGFVTALAAAMDFRSDVLLAWQQDGAIHAAMLRASRRPEPVQVVGASAPHPQLQALVSDNDHGMIAWSSSAGARGGTPLTRVYLSLSSAGVRFHSAKQLARYPDPQDAGRSPGSLLLQRLSTENVLLCFTSAEDGHYVVRAGQAVLAARGRSRLLSDPRSQAILNALAPGPAGEAVALWSSAPSTAAGGLDASRVTLWADRARIGAGSRVLAAAPEPIAAAGPNAAPALAVDPATDRALATWLTLGSAARVDYAVSGGNPSYTPSHPPPQAAVVGSGSHWLRITAAALAGVAALLSMALLLRRRRRSATRS
jgi:hypothetical protein